MKDIKRLSTLAIVLLVLLRISIGWQFLYEGLWKYNTLGGPQPWSAEGYLKQAEGPFRDYFLNMAGGDPYDLRWLDYSHVEERWNDFIDRFTRHYQLTEAQQARLQVLLDGPASHVADLPALPPSVSLDRFRNSISHEGGKLVVSGTNPLIPSEAQTLQNMVAVVKTPEGEYARKGADGQPMMVSADGEPVVLGPMGYPVLAASDGLPLNDHPVSNWSYVPPDNQERLFFIRIENLMRSISRDLGYRQRLAGLLRGDPKLVGVFATWDSNRNTYVPTMASAGWDPSRNEPLLWFGKIQEYRDTVAQYLEVRAQAQDTGLSHLYEHANRLQAKFLELKSEVVAPVQALDAEFRDKVQGLLDVDQIRKGPLPPEKTPVYQASMRAMWALLILGPLLILGLCTRVAALGGAAMLITFYLVIPPWPGVPQPPSPEHAYIVNKNLIEAIALLVLAAVPSGTWFGLDGPIARFFRGRRRSPANPSGKD